MNITPSTIYWVAQCDCIRDACIPIIMIGVILSVVSAAIAMCAFCDDTPDRVRRWRWIAAVVSLAIVATTFAGFLGRIFIPTTKTMAAMYIIPSVANNEKVQTVGNRLYDLAIEWMDELKPAKKEETK